MERTFEEEVKGGRIACRLTGNEVSVISCQVLEQCLEIPDSIRGTAVTEIGKKAILGDKTLRELALPAKLKEIGDWAFASCGCLERVWIPRKEIRFGRGTFKGCGRLSHISFAGEENRELSRRISGLIAMAPVMLEAEYLLAPVEAGEEAWLSRLDARLVTLLEKPDREGYSRQVLCGEEDLMASLELYLEERRKQKARLCYRRLLNDYGLSAGLREKLFAYLRENTKGLGDGASWRVLLEEHGSEKDYYQIFAEAGCITEENFQELLRDMGESLPEMKAWLIRYRGDCAEKTDFFAGLSLD